MMERMIAVCGIDCATCVARIATQANDEEAKKRVAAQWRVAYNAPNINTAYVTCDGCRAFDGRLGGHCPECEIRTCGVARGLPNCAHCDEYETCGKLAGFLKFTPPQVKATLDEIRAGI